MCLGLCICVSCEGRALERLCVCLCVCVCARCTTQLRHNSASNALLAKLAACWRDGVAAMSYTCVTSDASSAAQPARTDRTLDTIPEASELRVRTLMWCIGPSIHQVAAQHLTHQRCLPLAPTLDISIGDDHFTGQYQGHGKSKIAYLLRSCRPHFFSGKIFKLCKETDQEPELFAELSATGLYTQIHASSPSVVEKNSVAQPVGQWNAWVTDFATPLDQYLKQKQLPRALAKKCIIGCVRTMLHASTHGHIMSDNALFNFGKHLDDIKIIDAGSRPLQEVPNSITKGDFNTISMKKFWSKVRLVVHKTELATYQTAWQEAPDMDSARKTFDMLWEDLAEQPPLPSDSSSAEQHAVPNVAALLDCISIESLDWLGQNFLWGTLAIDDATGEQVSADVKLERLIKLTSERRERVCAHPRTDVLTEQALNDVLLSWKLDYPSWMHPESIQRSRSLTNQPWHQLLRRSFRTFLFSLVGCYEMSIFFLVAPFNPDTLDSFQTAWEQSATTTDALELSKRLVRDPWPTRQTYNEEWVYHRY